jgi:phosphoenolpyruvate-protein phosphotransferase
MRVLKARTIAPGMADGHAEGLVKSLVSIQDLPVTTDKETEILRLQRAFQRAKADLETLQAHVHQEFGASEAEIFAAHQLILDDPTLRGDILQRLNSAPMRAEKAIAASVENYMAQISEADDPYIRERALDIKDIGNRLIRHTSGISSSRLSTLRADSIVVAQELLPSDLVELDSERLIGIVTERCGETSHVAILARALGIPVLTGIRNVDEIVTNGQRLLLDGESAELVIEPTQSQLQEFRRKMRSYESSRATHLAEDHLPCYTKDGTEISLMANLGRPCQAELSIAAKLTGVGLLRTEFLFLDHPNPPSLDEQIILYTHVASRMADRDVCIRTLDLGGDKYPLFLKHAIESNPNMGVRGLRFSLGEGLGLFQTQVEALLKVSANHRVSILLPMVLGVEDLLESKKIIVGMAQNLGLCVPPIGVLVETPAAVLLIDKILEQADFINLGTNDLTQFILATDRNALDTHADYSVLHPAVLRAVVAVVQAARSKGKPVTVCGEAAGNPEIAALLVGLGIRRLSMSPSLTAPVRYLLRGQHLNNLESLAKEAIEASSISHVKEIVAELAFGESSECV